MLPRLQLTLATLSAHGAGTSINYNDNTITSGGDNTEVGDYSGNIVPIIGAPIGNIASPTLG